MSESKKFRRPDNNIHVEHKAAVDRRTRYLYTLAFVRADAAGATGRMGTISTRRTSSHIRRAGLPAAAIAIVLAMSGCGSSSSSSGTPSATLQKALAELNAGNFNDAKKDFQA